MLNKNNLLKILISILIIIIIIVIVLIIILNKEIEQNEKMGGDADAVTWSEEIIKLNNNTLFYTTQDCIINYLTYCYIDENQEEVAEEMSITDKMQYVYNILDKDYIKENNITLDTIRNYIETYSSPVTFDAKEMYVLNGEYIHTYAVQGKILLENDKRYVKDVYFIVNFDQMNGTYAIAPQLNCKSIKEIQLYNSNTRIEKNDDNTYQYTRLTDSQIIQKYLEDYQKVTYNNIEESYKLLNEEYRKAKYPTINEYKNYVESNKEQIQNRLIARYSITEYEDYTQYVCIDRNNNYFIINEKNSMDYDVILDSYTIDIQLFLDRYNKEKIETKCIMNVEKIKEALNSKDYKYVYNKLADSFKANYFNTQASFEQYINTNMYKKISIEYLDVEIQNNNYIFKVSITNLDDPLADAIEKTIVVQLKEGTDFVFSFSV